MALNGLYCADVPLSNYSVTHHKNTDTVSQSFLHHSISFSLQGALIQSLTSSIVLSVICSNFYFLLRHLYTVTCVCQRAMWHNDCNQE